MKIIDGIETEEVRGFEEIYYISKCGKLFRKYKYEYKRIEGSQTPRGYIQITLTNSKREQKRQRTTLLHRIVAEAYIDNPEHYGTVDHIDENKVNNHVDNLRWCSVQQNTEFYNTMLGENHRVKMRLKHKAKREKILGVIRVEAIRLEAIEKNIQKSYNELIDEKARFKKHIKEEEEKIRVLNEGYQGYRSTKGSKFNTLQDMVNKTGKPITVNGIRFISCGAAASYIMNNVVDQPQARKATISKELRRYLQGKRSSWLLYGQFTIGY